MEMTGSGGSLLIIIFYYYDKYLGKDISHHINVIRSKLGTQDLEKVAY